MFIGGRKIVYTNSFFRVTDIIENLHNYFSDFDRLFHEMVNKEPFINQEISYINGNGLMKFSTVSDYMKFLEYNRN